MKIKCLFTLAVVILSGCAHSSQHSYTKTTDPKTGIITEQQAEAKMMAIGNGKSIADSVHASAGKTASVGAKGVDQETDAIDKATVLLEVIKAYLGK